MPLIQHLYVASLSCMQDCTSDVQQPAAFGSVNMRYEASAHS